MDLDLKGICTQCIGDKSLKIILKAEEINKNT